MAARRRPYRETPPTYSNRDNTRGHGIPQGSSSDPAGRLVNQWSRRSPVKTPSFRRPVRFEFFETIDREVLVLRHFEELSNAETAQVLGLEKTAASNRYIRALEAVEGGPGRLPGPLRGLSRARPSSGGVPWRRTHRRRTTARSTGWPRSSSNATGAASDPRSPSTSSGTPSGPTRSARCSRPW